MANLATIEELNTNGEYVDLAELTDLTFTSGNKYQLQIIGGNVFLREGSIGKGNIVTTEKPFTWECQGDTLYINCPNAYVNIAE